MCGVFNGVCFPNLGVLRPCFPGSGETSACDGTWWTHFLFLFACTKQGFLTFPLLILSPIHLQSSLCTHQKLRSNFASWGQTTIAAFCAFSLYHHQSAVLAHTNWFKALTEDLFCSSCPSTSLSTDARGSFSVAEFPVCLCWIFYWLYWLISTSLLASLNGNTSLQISALFPSLVIREPAEGVRCGSLNYWNRSLKRGRDISAKTGDFQSLYWISSSATWFNFQVKCYSDIDYLLGSSHYLSYWCKQKINGKTYFFSIL